MDIRQNSQQCKIACVYHEQTCIGFLFGRGPAGVKAFNHDERSLGIFTDEHAAVTAQIGNRFRFGGNDRLSDLVANAAGVP